MLLHYITGTVRSILSSQLLLSKTKQRRLIPEIHISCTLATHPQDNFLSKQKKKSKCQRQVSGSQRGSFPSPVNPVRLMLFQSQSVPPGFAQCTVVASQFGFTHRRSACSVRLDLTQSSLITLVSLPGIQSQLASDCTRVVVGVLHDSTANRLNVTVICCLQQGPDISYGQRKKKS